MTECGKNHSNCIYKWLYPNTLIRSSLGLLEPETFCHNKALHSLQVLSNNEKESHDQNEVRYQFERCFLESFMKDVSLQIYSDGFIQSLQLLGISGNFWGSSWIIEVCFAFTSSSGFKLISADFLFSTSEDFGLLGLTAGFLASFLTFIMLWFIVCIFVFSNFGEFYDLTFMAFDFL